MSESMSLLQQLVASAERAGLNGYHAVRRMLPAVPAEQVEAAWQAHERAKCDAWWTQATAGMDLSPLTQEGGAE